jgi:ribosomal protein L37E
MSEDEQLALIKGEAIPVSDSYTCPRCGRTSYNPNDAANKYCGYCHEFEEDQDTENKRLKAEIAFLKSEIDKMIRQRYEENL